MNAEYEQVLRDVFCEVTEQLAFMFGEPAEKDDLPAPDGECLETSMRFTGDRAGTLSLAVPAAVAPEVAANVLGLDPDDPSVQAGATDALKEMLNVTCGHVVTALAGEEPVFDLSVPEIRSLDPDQWQARLDDPQTVAFLLDDNPVLLRLSLEGEMA